MAEGNHKKISFDEFQDMAMEAVADLSTDTKNIDNAASEETKTSLYDDQMKLAALKLYLEMIVSEFRNPNSYYSQDPSKWTTCVDSPADIFTCNAAEAKKREEAQKKFEEVERDESSTVFQLD